MAANLKHGGHRYTLSIPGGAAAATADNGAAITFDGEAAAILGVIDQAVEAVKSIVLVAAATIAAVATNNFAIRVTHYSVLGTIKNRILYTNVAAGLAFTAGVPVDLSGAATATITVPNGVAVIGDGWKIAPGDSIVAERVTVGTGEITPAIGCTIKVGSVGT